MATPVGALHGSKSARPADAFRPGEKLACVPVLVLAGVIATLQTVPCPAVYEAHLLLPVLNLIFSTLISLLVAGLAASSYIAGRPLAALLLGSGMLAFGVTSGLSGIGIPAGRYNDSVTIYSVGVCLAGLCNVLGALSLLPPIRDRMGQRPWVALGVSYGGVLVAMLVTAAATYGGLLPEFFVEGQGLTPTRRLVFGAAIWEFVAASGLLILVGRRARSRFLHWYSLGLLLIALGFCGVYSIKNFGDALGWVGRGCIHLGGVYVLVAAIIAVCQSRGWAIPISALRETHQRYTSLVDLCPDAILVHAEGRYVFANPAAARLFGATSPKGLVGLPVMDLVHPDSRCMVKERIQQLLDGHEVSPACEVRLLRLDGTCIEAEGAGARVEHEGRPAVQVVIRDVSERKRAQEAMREAKEVAEEANAAKDRFLAVLSHELRTPLSPVLMTASAWEQEDSLPAEVREDMSLIHRSVDLEVRLINDLLDFNRARVGKLGLELRPLDAHEKLRATVEICLPEAMEKQINIDCELRAGASWVNADCVRLQQIFWNLLRNAIKFTPPGGRIEVRSSNREEGMLRIEVADSGMGIAAEALPHVFEPFVQASTRVTRKFGGLGLGLAISRSLVEMHGGSIRAESAGYGTGATFTVELPTVTAREGNVAVPEISAPAAKGMRVLVVEDHEVTAEVVARLLTGLGHRVWRAGTVSEGLGLLESEEFDLLVCDLGLPDGSGHDLMRQAREIKPGLRAFALSGYGMDADRERSREAGFLEHLTKPVDLRTLKKTIERVAAG